MKRILSLTPFILVLITLYLVRGLFVVRAQEVACNDPTSCQEAIDKYTAELGKLSVQKNTLKNQISSYTNQIQLTTFQIEQTKFQIASLSARITNLEGNLDHLSDVFRKRTVESYELTTRLDPFAIFLASENFSSFVERLKYLRVIQISDHNLMVQLEETRSNYDDQKTVAQLLAKKLDAQKIKLNQLKAESSNLLKGTENDEKKYQQLLAQARAELSAFRRFVSLQGGASILTNQTVCDGWGCYYNQRDSQWGNVPLGSSNLSTAEFGCLVSSAAMVAKHYGRDIKPIDISLDPTAFFSPNKDTALLWLTISVKGVNIERTRVGTSLSSIDSELQSGRPVIVGLFSGPGHFVVFKSGSNGNYIMNDPFVENGHDISFTSKYKLSDITDVEKVNVN